MQSKTSCFNVGIFKNNIKRFWPVAAIIFFFFLALLPLDIYSEWSYRKSYFEEGVHNLSTFVPETISNLNVPFMEFVFAAFAVFLIFGYMFSSRSSYMMCAFPVERKTWLFTNIVSILCLEIVPVIINVIFAAIFCAMHGLGGSSYFLFFIVQNMCYFLIFDGIAMLAVFVAGNVLGAVGSYMVLNFIAYMTVTFLHSLQKVFLLGYSPEDLVASSGENALSPCLYLSNRHIGIALNYGNGAEVPTVSIEGIPAFIIYSLAGIALMAVCLLIGKKRRTETAGDLLSFYWIKKAFQIIVSAFFSVIITNFVVSDFRDRFVISYAEAFVLMIIGVTLVGMISYYAFEMFARKTLKVFSMKQFKNFLIYSAGMILVMVIVKCDPTGFEKKIPKVEEIEWAGFCYDAGYTYTTADAQGIIDMQKLFVENREVLKNIKTDGGEYANGVTFKYKKKDGKLFFRRYYIADTTECKALYDTFVSELKVPDRMKAGTINPNWKELKPTGVELYCEKPVKTEYGTEWESEWKELKLSQDELDVLYMAVLKDIDEGNVNPLYSYENDEVYENQLSFNLKSRNLVLSCDEVFNEYVNGGAQNAGMIQDTYYSIELEPSMTNTIDAMIKVGAINSKNDLILRSEIYEE